VIREGGSSPRAAIHHAAEKAISKVWIDFDADDENNPAIGRLYGLSRVHALRPGRIQCDNGSKFISRIFGEWAYECGVTLDFSRPNQSMDNAMNESFNGMFRNECLNANWFLPIE